MKRKIFICLLSFVLLFIMILPNVGVFATHNGQTYIPVTFSELSVYFKERNDRGSTFIFDDSCFPYPVLPIGFTEEYTQYATEFRKEYPQRYLSLSDYTWGGDQFINRIFCSSEQNGFYECDLYDTYDYAAYATNAIWCKTLLLDKNWEYSYIDLYMNSTINWKNSTPKEVDCANGKKIYLITKTDTYADTVCVTSSAWQFIDDKYAIVIALSANFEKETFNGKVVSYYETLATRLAEGTTVLQIPLTATDSEIDAMIAAVDTDSFSIDVPDYVNYIPSTPKSIDYYIEKYLYICKPNVYRYCGVDEEFRYMLDSTLPNYFYANPNNFSSEEPSQEVSEEISDVTSDDVSVEESSYSAESIADTISAEESDYSPESNGGESPNDNGSKNTLIAVITVAGALAVCAVVLLIVFKPKKKEE